MSYLGAPTTDISDAGSLVRAMGSLAQRYRRIVADPGSASRFTDAQPVRRTGFTAELQVAGVDVAATDVAVITLVRPDGAALPAWTPGAHIDVFTSIGRQRHYSLTGDPADSGSYRIAVRRIPDGAGSAEMHDLREGDTVRIRGPRNAFRVTDEPAYHFIAGGIGITPILPMIRVAAARGSRWTLDYLGRSRSTLPFLSELESLARTGTLRIRCDDEHGEPEIADLFAGDDYRTPVFLCGPTGLMDAVTTYLDGQPVRPRVHSERFTAPAVRGETPFTAVLARSGLTVEVGPDESALTAIRRQLPIVNYSCQQGFCGACKTTVLDGQVDHRDRVLVGDELADSMMICVSRGAGGCQVVLDL
ncbi:oxidoreductase [Mycobacterium sp. M1]|uniref:Oxidoreductase n=1 Tax=Mycolicibacter acidiphilus TaxID=2835306 RepID=A0ABS5RMJ6_9MYCO|nr:PDR/VanB family oxidoreductase [Mycolicibacter acidiphilus]MBS9534789.1 oxidoreductase [Mycolicibacter acidiphilus]